jgi:iron complex transport system substrate-binding protein
MSLRSLVERIAVLVLAAVAAAPALAGEFIDSASRDVIVPESVARVVAAGPTAEVLVFVLAPDKLIGWTRPLTRTGAPYIPEKYRKLPTVGRITGPNAATADAVRRLHPDLIIDAGPITAERAAFADQFQQQTGIPYLLVDGSLQRTPQVLRAIGHVLGVSGRANELAMYAEHAITAVRGGLLIRPASERPRVYYGRRMDGLETGLPGSPAGEEINENGVINAAGALGRDARVTLTPEELNRLNPSIIVAEDLTFYNQVMRDFRYQRVNAVIDRRVYLAPSDPFGWIDDPPGVNRLIGLYWLTSIFYPDTSQEDLRTNVKEFYDKFYGLKLTDAQIEALVNRAEAKPGETKRAAGEPLVGVGAAPPAPAPLPPAAGLPRLRPPGRGGSTPGGTVLPPATSR